MENTIVIFGASGDLTSRKLIPALYELKRKGRLPDGTRIIGTSRTEFSHDEWREKLAQSTAEFVGQRFDRKVWDELAPSVFYQPGDMESPELFPKLGDFLAELEAGRATTRLYYLSTAPRFYEPAARGLGAAGMASETDAPRRIVIEKPFGTDLASARVPQQGGPRDLRGTPGLPDRPLPGQRDGVEHLGRCGSPTRSLNRSGIATTSTTCRLPPPSR